MWTQKKKTKPCLKLGLGLGLDQGQEVKDSHDSCCSTGWRSPYEHGTNESPQCCC